MTTAAEQPPEPGGAASVEDLEADIAATRERLADTVDALGERLDVKSRARAAITERRQPIVAVAVIGALVAVFLLWRRRR